MFRRSKPTPAELAVQTAEMRWLRATALRAGLDPDRTAPEDVLLMREDKDGNLAVMQELDKAQRWLAVESAPRLETVR